MAVAIAPLARFSIQREHGLTGNGPPCYRKHYPEGTTPPWGRNGYCRLTVERVMPVATALSYLTGYGVGAEQRNCGQSGYVPFP